jgi:hypothetical protein
MSLGEDFSTGDECRRRRCRDGRGIRPVQPPLHGVHRATTRPGQHRLQRDGLLSVGWHEDLNQTCDRACQIIKQVQRRCLDPIVS